MLKNINGKSATLRLRFWAVFTVSALSFSVFTLFSDAEGSAAETENAGFPSGKIIIENSVFETFLNTVTFGLFRLGNTTFEIVSSAPSIGYIIAEIPFYNETPALDPAVIWTPYTAPVQINANFKGVIYAKLENELNLVSVISSEGLVVYSDSAAVDTEITYYKGSFDDLTAEVELNGNTVSEIHDGIVNLIPDIHYIVSGDMITFRASYLESLSADEYELTISYNPYGVPGIGGENNTFPPDTKIKLIISNPVITIDSQPAANIEFFENEQAVTLEVAASVNAGAVLSYQWYRNSSNSNTGGTAIDGANESKYTPPVIAETVYYYCVVSATGGAVSVTSEVATYTVNEKYWSVTFSANNPSWGTVTAQVFNGSEWVLISSGDKVRHGSRVRFTAVSEYDYRREFWLFDGEFHANNSTNRERIIDKDSHTEIVFREIPPVDEVVVLLTELTDINNNIFDLGVKGVGYTPDTTKSFGVHNRSAAGGQTLSYLSYIAGESVNNPVPNAFIMSKSGDVQTDPPFYSRNQQPVNGSDNFYVTYKEELPPGEYSATVNVHIYIGANTARDNPDSTPYEIRAITVKFTVRPSVTLPVFKDGEPWSDHGKKFTLRQDDVVIKTAQLIDGDVVFGIDDGGVDPGTYNIFDGETDTGKTVTISDGSGNVTAERLDYYTVEFSSTTAGTVSESRVSAIYDGITIDSGAVVISGKELVITAKGNGADGYKYDWSGQGTETASGHFTNTLTIQELSETVDAVCTISGEITHYIATVNINKNNAPWEFHGKTFTISNDGGFTHTHLTDNYNGTLSERLIVESVESSPWVIYENGSSTDITVTPDNNSATFDYYTVNFFKNDIGYVIGSAIFATYDGVPIVNGAIVPGGKELIISVTADDGEIYGFNWRGDGTNGENTNILKIENLSDRVNAICDITGAAVTSETTTPETSETSASESNTTTPMTSTSATSATTTFTSSLTSASTTTIPITSTSATTTTTPVTSTSETTTTSTYTTSFTSAMTSASTTTAAPTTSVSTSATTNISTTATTTTIPITSTSESATTEPITFASTSSSTTTTVSSTTTATAATTTITTTIAPIITTTAKTTTTATKITTSTTTTTAKTAPKLAVTIPTDYIVTSVATAITKPVKPETPSVTAAPPDNIPETTRATTRAVTTARTTKPVSDIPPTATAADTRITDSGEGKIYFRVEGERGQAPNADVVSEDKAVDAILRNSERGRVKSGEDAEVVVKVQLLRDNGIPTNDKERIEHSASYYAREIIGLKIGSYIDIETMYRVGNDDFTVLSETDGKIGIILNIPGDLITDGAKYYIIRCHEGVTALLHDLDDNPETVTFETALFSTYAIAYTTAENELTGINIEDHPDGSIFARNPDGTYSVFGKNGKLLGMYTLDTGGNYIWIPGNKYDVCYLCRFCPCPLGLCVFIWLLIILSAVAVIVYTVKKSKKKSDGIKNEEEDEELYQYYLKELGKKDAEYTGEVL